MLKCVGNPVVGAQVVVLLQNVILSQSKLFEMFRQTLNLLQTRLRIFFINSPRIYTLITAETFFSEIFTQTTLKCY